MRSAVASSFVFVNLTLICAHPLFAQKPLVTQKPLVAQKEALYDSINRRDGQTWNVAHDIWGWAEPGYQEKKSSTRLAKLLEEAGFEIRRGVADIPTAFTAQFGSGKPLIAILGEFDALPGLSQAAVPYRQPRDGVTYGHACGHHLFGAASASAAIAIAEQIKAGQLTGTVRFYGCPAEEGGSAKAFMVQSGLFKDCAAVLHWHPSHRNSAGDRSTLARMAVKFRFHGKAAHAAGAPEQGRSALDGRPPPLQGYRAVGAGLVATAHGPASHRFRGASDRAGGSRRGARRSRLRRRAS